MISLFNFMFGLGQAATDITRLLNVRFLPGTRQYEGAIGRALSRILELNNEGRLAERDAAFARMLLFAKQLREIEAADPALLEVFAKRFRDDVSVSGYLGTRHEVQVAATLIRNHVTFACHLPDAPDFKISEVAVGIECTSAHVIEDKSTDDLAYKIGSAIRTKSKKAYAKTHVALSIECSSIDYIQSEEAANRGSDLARELIEGSTSFGSVLLHTQLLNQDANPPVYMANYNRIDHSGINANLREVLDRAFPFGEGISIDSYVRSPGP